MMGEESVADIRSFRGLRYHLPGLADLIAPPYDVITPQDREALCGRSPYNVVHVELPQEGDDGYREAAETLAAWLARGVLQREEGDALYLYDLEFQHQGRACRRRSLFCRLRLEPWDRGLVLPHEATLAAPKEDRLRLLRATRTQISPIFALYRNHTGQVASALSRAIWEDLASFSDHEGRRHTLHRLADPEAQEAIAAAFAPETLYSADGHHRYETALAYREERRAQVKVWRGEEPENFVLAALTAASDPGLVVLPIHRLSRQPLPLDWRAKLAPHFHIWTMPGELDGLLEAMSSHAGPCYGLLERGGMYLLNAAERAGLEALLPSGCPAVWRRLEVALLQYAVLEGLLGIAGEALDYTEDARRAWGEVTQGAFAGAFLLRPTTAEDVFAVAEAGARMPPKSTFFYPKLPTGLVLNGLE